MVAVLNWCLNHWWLFLFLSVLGVFEAVGEFFTGIIASAIALSDRRHRRQLEIARALSSAPAPRRPKPGRCVHRQVKQVRSGDELVAWLCTSCDRQLPADWAVSADDL